MTHGSRTPGAAAGLALGREVLMKRLRTGRIDPVRFVRKASHVHDVYFIRRLREISFPGAPFALLAVGGYGRGTLCPGSDVDALLVFEEIPDTADDLAAGLFHPLWDLGLELGHGVRDLRGCLELAATDPQVLTSLLDARFLAGEETIFRDLLRELDRIMPEAGALLVADVAEQEAASKDGVPDASTLTPDIKGGPGALRDSARVRWLLRVAEGNGPFACDALCALNEHEEFLLAARTVLHLHAGHRTNRLPMDLQPEIARDLGFRAEKSALGVELFLARLGHVMSEVRAMRAAALRCAAMRLGLCADKAGARPEGTVSCRELEPEGRLKTPQDLFDLFLRQAEQGDSLSWRARSAVREAAHRLAGELPEATGARAFLTALLSAAHASVALGSMLEAGFLGALVPELGRVQDLVQFDDYHLHPLGRHVVAAVEALHRMAGEDSPVGEILTGLESGDREALFLAALLHDMGKGGEEDHSRRGAILAREVLERLRTPRKVVAEVCFLVENHLLLARTALARDMGEESVVAEVAGAAGNARRLSMLYLLTVADSRATGPRAWNEWTASLMAECFFKARKLVTRDVLAEPHAAARVMAVRDKVRAEAGKQLGQEAAGLVEECLSSLPPRYTLNHSAREIVAHLALVREMERETQEEMRRVPGGRGGIGVIAMEAVRGETPGRWRLSVAARRQPRLFATVCGVLALSGVNILAAEVSTFGGGRMVVDFTVSDPPDPLYADELWRRVAKYVKAAMTGRLALDYRIAEKRRSLLAATASTGLPPRVRTDSQDSDFYTILIVEADDRPGRLYDMAEVMHDLGIQVFLARIVTAAGRVADTFFVRDAVGDKLDPEQERELIRALTHSLTD